MFYGQQRIIQIHLRTLYHHFRRKQNGQRLCGEYRRADHGFAEPDNRYH